MGIVFSSASLGIVVFQNEDGSYSWLGQYNGMPIKRAIPINKGAGCILLIDPDSSNRAAFENLLCIDVNGQSTWIAVLPTSTDAFLDVSLSSEGLVAHTWSCMKIFLDKNSGSEINREFTK